MELVWLQQLALQKPSVQVRNLACIMQQGRTQLWPTLQTGAQSKCMVVEVEWTGIGVTTGEVLKTMVPTQVPVEM
jgi:hypothetical protein